MVYFGLRSVEIVDFGFYVYFFKSSFFNYIFSRSFGRFFFIKRIKNVRDFVPKCCLLMNDNRLKLSFDFFSRYVIFMFYLYTGYFWWAILFHHNWTTIIYASVSYVGLFQWIVYTSKSRKKYPSIRFPIEVEYKYLSWNPSDISLLYQTKYLSEINRCLFLCILKLSVK